MESLIGKPIESNKFKLRSSLELEKNFRVELNSESTPVVRNIAC